ncbi:hypothetical protein GCM10009122_57140 [Fulvivirga kasyanovii]|uniref:Amino acid adenylation domain-containing protein n=1 Tax=Fulvivirga kasyanovii TaxID=396812 RepID=A0ABW9RXC3_9BACT|nr:non-ribosomal peptide synthetase [Fulvivirga kasyanovii]MTI27660.1 amino acid adenylation domain-containing protein [Fulvivirga kasyanovii]
MDQELFYQLSKEEKQEYLIGLVESMKGKGREEKVQQQDRVAYQTSGEPFPLSDIQESFFSGRFLSRKSDYVGCHIYFEFEDSYLDTDRLQLTWNKLVQHHDMLRLIVMGNATQRIQANVEIPPFQVYDLCDKPEGHRDQTLNELRKRLSHKVYEPGDWPLYEIAITHLPQNKSIIHLSIDEWITDGYSMSLLLNQWYNLYKNPASALPALSYSFRDYVLETKALENTPKFQKDMAYWKSMKIHNGPALPYRESMPAKPDGQQCYYRKRIHKVLEAKYWESLKEKCLTMNVNPTALLLTVFTDTLARYSGIDPFSIILTLFNRQPLHPQIDEVVGPFVSTNFFNVYPQAEKTIASKVQDNQRYLWDLLDHGSVSGIRALRESREKHAASHLSVPIVFTSMINKSGSAGKNSWLEKMGYSISQTPQIYLDHQVYEYNNELHLNWDVVEEAFEPGILNEMMDAYYQSLSNLAIGGLHMTSNDLSSDIAGATSQLSPPSSVYSLSSLQQSYYVSRKYGEIALVYQEFEIEHIDVNRLKQAWHKVIQRHEMLHSVITKDGNFQILDSIPHYPTIVEMDWSNLGKEEQLNSLQQMRKLQAEKKFDYGKYPWFSLSVSLTGSGKATLHCCFDGIVGDGQSISNIYKELFELYEQPSKELPPVEYGYSRYRARVDSLRQSAQYATSKAYWENKLKKIVPGPNLIEQKAGVPHRRLTGISQDWAALKMKARQYNITEDTLLFSLYALAIGSICKEERFSIVYVDWKRSPIHSPLVGDFSSLCWVEIDRKASDLVQLMQRCDNAIRQDMAAKTTNGLEVLGRLIYQGHKHLTFPVVYTNIIDQTNEGKFENITPGYGFSITPNVLIDNMSFVQGNELHYCWDVPEHKDSNESVEEAFRKYEHLLSMLCQNDDWTNISPWKQFNAGNTQNEYVESSTPVESFNANTTSDTVLEMLKPLNLDSKTIQGEFEAQVNKHPERVALTFEGNEMTYAALNKRANQLARYLQKFGAGPEEKIVVCMDRSFEMIVSIMGVLKSGAAYVPLDPALPEERLGMILEDARPIVIVSTSEHSNKLFRSSGKIINYDLDVSLIENEDGANLPVQSNGGNLAYIIYTSGTTGKPKGTLISHYNVIRLFLATQNWFHFNEKDTWTLFHSFTFDFSVWEIFGALLYGGKLVVVPYAVSRSFDRFYDLLCREKVTVLNQTPTAFRQLCRVEEQKMAHDGLALRYVIFGGEALNLQHLRSWISRHGDQKPELINMYGITETTVHVTYRRIFEADLDTKESLIGMPIPDLTVHILDQNKRPVPHGMEGEMYVGGLGVARAYLHRSELTAERFIPNPFTSQEGAKLYRTGDLGKMLSNGEIAYLGRIDSQVKVRGFRIELEDIESAINRHENVSEAVVVIKEADTDPQIVAYVIPKQHEMTPEKELRQFLRKILPDYMVPTSIIKIDEFPLNHNGKLDKSKLPWKVPVKNALATEDAIKVLSRPLSGQQELIEIFRNCLSVEEVNPEDDIFDLGATSLSLILITQEIKEKLGAEVPMELFLDRSKVGDIISDIGYDAGNSASEDIVDQTGTDILDSVQTVFQQVLNTDQVSADDDIFDLGCTSLTLIFVIEEIKKTLNVELPIETFLDHTTIRGVAGCVEANCTTSSSNGVQVAKQSGYKPEDNSRRETVSAVPLMSKSFKDEYYLFTAPQYDFVQKEIPGILFSEFMALLRQHQLGEESKYLYPSAGGKNSVQTYIHVKPGKVEGVNGGVYYYHPVEHQLYEISDGIAKGVDIHHPGNHELYQQAAFQIFFVIQLAAMTPIYMGYSQELATLEAGYMTQLLLSRQANFGLGVCPVQGVEYDAIRGNLKLEEEQVIVECLFGGIVDYETYKRQPELYNTARLKHELTGQFKNIDAHFTRKPQYRDFAEIVRIHGQKQFNPLSEEEQQELLSKQLHLRKFDSPVQRVPLKSRYFTESELATRATQRDYVRETISLDSFSNLLQYMSQRPAAAGSPSLYPSVGRSYGVKFYLYLRDQAVEGLAEGVYHYSAEAHTLRKINDLSVPLEHCHSPFNLVTCRKASVFLFLVVDMEVLEAEFGANAATYVYKEAGHIGQLLMDHQAECDLGLMPVGGMSFDKISQDFKLKSSQMMIHSFMGGKVHYSDRRSSDLSASSQEAFKYLSLSAVNNKYTLQPSRQVLPEPELTKDSVPATRSYPLSYGQRSLWYMYKSAPESYAYNSGFHVNILSAVDDKLMSRAIQALVDQHDILRVSFEENDGEPVQIVHKDFKIIPNVIEAQGWSNEQVTRAIEEEYKKPFDLENEPIMKVYLYHQSEESHYLFLNLHHIITDYYSTSMLIQQLLDTYAALLHGESPDNNAGNVQTLSYMEFVEWQKEMLTNGTGSKMLDEWKHLLADEVPVMKLPHDNPRPVISSQQGGTVHFEVNKEVYEKFKSIAKQEKSTLFMTFLTVFSVLLHKYVPDENVVLGTLATARGDGKFNKTLGYFINPIVLWLKLNENMSFPELLGKVRSTVFDSLKYKDYPFPLLVEKLQPNRNSSIPPLFQVTFQFLNSQIEDSFREEAKWYKQALKLKSFEMLSQEGQFDLELELMEGLRSVRGKFMFDADLFHQSTVEQMSQHFIALLEQISSDPGCNIGELSVLTDAEREKRKSLRDQLKFNL